MQFNGTLIVQIGNFILSWWVLDKFFFRRCVAQVEGERSELRTLEQAVIDQKIELEISQKDIKKAVKESQQLFCQSLPSITSELCAKAVSAHVFIFPQECSVSTQQKLGDEVVARLVQRMTHGV